MPFIDHRGRFFGRWNLIDATVLGAVGVVSALGYGAFLLFQTPDPTIGSITPAEVIAGQPGTLRVTGTRLRSFLSARLECGGDTAGCESLTVPLRVVGPTRAEVNVRNLTPGFYDFVLLDEARELVRIPSAVRALTVAAMPALTMDVQAVGAFVFLTDTDASLIVPGAILDEEPSPDRLLPLTSVGTIVKVSPAEASIQRLRIAAANTRDATTLVANRFEVPAIVTMRCTITADHRCRISGTNLFEDTLVSLALSVPEDQKFTRPVTHVAFRVDELRPVTAPPEFPQRRVATVRVKIFARAETAGLPRVGDEDFSVPVAADVATQASAGRTRRATVVAIDAQPKQLPATVRIGDLEYQEPMTTFEASFDVPVSLMPNGWMYADRRPIKVGGSFTFEGPTYVITGWIVDVRVARSTPSALSTR